MTNLSYYDLPKLLIGRSATVTKFNQLRKPTPEGDYFKVETVAIGKIEDADISVYDEQEFASVELLVTVEGKEFSVGEDAEYQLDIV